LSIVTYINTHLGFKHADPYCLGPMAKFIDGIDVINTHHSSVTETSHLPSRKLRSGAVQAYELKILCPKPNVGYLVFPFGVLGGPEYLSNVVNCSNQFFG